MPVYSYRCRACEYEFDRNQRMSEAPLVECPNCAEPELRKVLNSVGVVFKGSGFYVTDNRNKSAKSAGNKTENGSKSESADNSTTESKSTAESNGDGRSQSNGSKNGELSKTADAGKSSAPAEKANTPAP